MSFSAYILDVLTSSVYPARITIADGKYKGKQYCVSLDTLVKEGYLTSFTLSI